MRVMHVSTYETAGGAARATQRLHSALRWAGVESMMVVGYRQSDDSSVQVVPVPAVNRVLRKRLRFLENPRWCYPGYTGSPWSSGWLSVPLARFAEQLKPSIVHLHWTGMHFLSIPAIARITRPLVWTLHDMWAFTGGCHYSEGCERFQVKCGGCPQLGSNDEHDLSRFIWRRKARVWERLNITLIAPSRWMADCARKSSLLGDKPIEIIPNTVDIERFQPYDRRFARHVLGLPQNSKLVLFGAHRVDDARKGYRQLQDALYMLSHHKSVELVSFGEGTMPHQNALPVHAMGRIDDERVLALLYSAVDVFCAPSLYDNLPNTAIEAQACATPVVAFAVGGMSDIVQHEQTGYLAQPNDTADFSHGIAWVLEDQTRQDMLGNVARAKAVEQFSPERVARLHLDLYQRLPE